ncbi:MAG: VCBS repeat-containing protein, partial [Planctomycetota bacterium]|nr:VCBS repeat-containing protein [Planctomycetota bacterium]
MKLFLPFLFLFVACSQGESARPIHFTDITAGSGLHMKLTNGEDPPQMLLEVKGNGVALIDFDRDGDSDVFVPNGATLRRPGRGPGSRLFENEGGMRFRDITQQAGIDLKNWAYGVAMGDVNADGFDDLLVTCYGQNAILLN